MDEAGWCCMGEPQVDKVETLFETIDNIFEKMNRRVIPSYDTGTLWLSQLFLL